MYARRLYFAAAVLGLALVGAADLVLPRSDADPSTGPVRGLAARSFDTLEVTRAGVKVSVRRGDGRFDLIAPVAYPADEPTARAAFSALEHLDLVAPPAARAAIPGGGGDDELRVTARQDGRALLELFVGRRIEGGTLVRIGGRDGRWKARGAVRELFDKSPNEWRDHQITSFASGDAERIAVETFDGARIALARSRGGDADHDRWRVTSSSVPIGNLDDRVPRELVTTLSWLEASDFADTITPAAAGLEPPALTVSVGLAGGRTASVLIGKATGRDGKLDEFFVKTPDRPQILVVKRFNVDRINRRPVQFRDKTLCDIPDADMISFRVTRGPHSYEVVRDGGAWHATHPSGLEIDPDKVAPLATVFRRWSAPVIAEDPPGNAVSAPRAVIVGHSKNSSCTIRVGREPKREAGYFIQTPASRDIYIVPKWMIDRIAVRLDEIQKA
jgi:hypothetical protein